MRWCSLLLRLVVFSYAGLVVGAIFGVVPMQALVRANLALSGKLATPVEGPIALTVHIPDSYGLTPRERAEGWEPLNQKKEQTVVLRDGPFQLTFPPVLYCTYRSRIFQPPPASQFVLRFSDAPDETYYLWRDRRGAGYAVTQGTAELPKDEAKWRITIGGFSRAGGDSQAPWVLDVELARQPASSRGVEREVRRPA